MKRNQIIKKRLEIIGYCLVALAFIINERELCSTLIVCLLVLCGLILMIPDYVDFYKNQMNQEKDISDYWKYKLLTLQILIITFVIITFMELLK